MRKLTKKDIANIHKGKGPKNWDAGMRASVSMDWEHETHVISANEVMKDFKKYVEKWPGKKKFKLIGNVDIHMDWTR